MTVRGVCIRLAPVISSFPVHRSLQVLQLWFNIGDSLADVDHDVLANFARLIPVPGDLSIQDDEQACDDPKNKKLANLQLGTDKSLTRFRFCFLSRVRHQGPETSYWP